LMMMVDGETDDEMVDDVDLVVILFFLLF